MRISALLVAGTLALCATTGMAQQAPYPVRPVRLIVANVPGSPPDNVGRLLAARLSEVWSQQVVVDNRAGATGLIAADTVSRAAPDGYTLWLPTLTQLISTLQAQRLTLAKDFAPVALIASTPFVVIANASLPPKSLSEFIAYAKTRPGQLTFGSAGQWSSSHLCMESLKTAAGIDLLHVPYNGTTPALNDLIGGRIDAYCAAGPSLPALVQTGRARALGVTYLKPTRLAPGVPPVAETLPGFELLGWYGLQAPLETPRQLVAKINADVAKALKSPEFQERLMAVGSQAAGSTPEAFGAFLKNETTRWDKVLRAGGGTRLPQKD